MDSIGVVSNGRLTYARITERIWKDAFTVQSEYYLASCLEGQRRIMKNN
jgi:hypothetical protein